VAEALEQREDERCRLAGACLGGGQDVATGEDEGDRLALDGRRLGVSLRGDRAKEVGREPE